MRVSRKCRSMVAALTGAAATVTLSVMLPVGTAGAATSSSAPGVTPTSITVGTISTQTGTLAANSSSLIYGEKAYFDYINAQGGVNGRKIDYKYALDDGGNPTTFNQLANTLINQDHVFAVSGVATIFFSPNLFVESGIPTYGYNVTDNWAGPDNLFAAGGSVQYYQAGAAEFAYVARKTQPKPSIALLAYRVAASSNACQAAENAMQSEGYDISYVDLKINYPGTTVATDVQRMRQAGSNFGTELHGCAGQRRLGAGHPPVRAQGDAALVERQRRADPEGERELDAGRVLRHLPRALHSADQPLPGTDALLATDEEVRARLRLQRAGDPRLGVRRPFRARREGGGKRSDVGQRDQTDQRHHVVHGGWSDDAGQLVRRGSHQPCPAVLRRLRHGQRHAVRSRPEQRSERLELFPFPEHEGEPGLPGPSRYTRATLAGSRKAGRVPVPDQAVTGRT